MINIYFIWLIWHYTLSTCKPLADFKKNKAIILIILCSTFQWSFLVFHSPILLALLCFWIALIQTDGGDSPFYLCLLISLNIPLYLKYSKRTKVLSKELWTKGGGVDAISWKGTLCCQTWKVHVSAWEWGKMNYAKQSNWETDVAIFLYFILSTLNTSWWPGAIFKSTETKL